MKKSLMKVRIKDFILEEMEDEKASRTSSHYERILNLFVDSLQNENVTKADLIEFKRHMLEKYKPRTVNNYIVIINKFIKYYEIIDKGEEFNFKKLKKFYSSNTLKIIKIQDESSLKEIVEPEDLKRMLKMAKKKDYEIYLIIKIISLTGIRVNELKEFTYENIQKNYIVVRNKGKVRNIILTNDLQKKLIDFCKKEKIESGFIFRGKNENTMISYTTIYRRLKKIAGMCRGIKLDKIHPHSFRHLFAIKYLEIGGTITELADILGHKSVNTTMIYTRTTDKMKKKKLEQMKY